MHEPSHLQGKFERNFIAHLLEFVLQITLGLRNKINFTHVKHHERMANGNPLFERNASPSLLSQRCSLHCGIQVRSGWIGASAVAQRLLVVGNGGGLSASHGAEYIYMMLRWLLWTAAGGNLIDAAVGRTDSRLSGRR